MTVICICFYRYADPRLHIHHYHHYHHHYHHDHHDHHYHYHNYLIVITITASSQPVIINRCQFLPKCRTIRQHRQGPLKRPVWHSMHRSVTISRILEQSYGWARQSLATSCLLRSLASTAASASGRSVRRTRCQCTSDFNKVRAPRILPLGVGPYHPGVGLSLGPHRFIMTRSLKSPNHNMNSFRFATPVYSPPCLKPRVASAGIAKKSIARHAFHFIHINR